MDIQATEVFKCDLDGNPIGEAFPSKSKACQTAGIEAKELNECLADFTKTAGGFRWRLKSEVEKFATPTPAPLFKSAEIGEKNVSRGASEETVTMSEADLEELLGNFERKIKSSNDSSELVRELVAQLNPGAQVSYARAEENVDMGDFLEEPVMFYTYLNKYAIYGERRYGQEVRTPYGRPIVFTNISGHVSGAKNHGKTTVQISACQVQTKKELEWMKKSPKYNTVFFESIGELSQIDKYRAQKLADAMTEISTLSEYAVTQRALASGIPPNKDVEVMKHKLIQKIAEDSMKTERAISSSAAVPSDASLKQILDRGQVSGASVRSY